MIAAILAVFGTILLILAVSIANSSRPGTKRRWLRAAIAAPLAALGLFLALKPASAQEFKSARFPNGATVELYQRGGSCPSGKQMARWISWDKVTVIGGCYAKSESGAFVTILWEDGDESVVAEQVFKIPGGV